MMIETDAPFMLPKNVPNTLLKKYHVRRCEPAFLLLLPEQLHSLKEFRGLLLRKKLRRMLKSFLGFKVS
ncbi:hypothetical protein [Flavobacterium sp. MR2016-29]|uniref:hypothetical protein n=1 Tax=Flavobacterium sp. MR2016-29 TaxID=2783795 RepID=UPI003977CB97